jgi:hypothetical protein
LGYGKAERGMDSDTHEVSNPLIYSTFEEMAI